MPGLPASLTDHPRVRIRRPGDPDSSGDVVVYWMQRAQRAVDNPALEAAVRAANHFDRPLQVLFRLVADFSGADLRHYDFMLRGLAETREQLVEMGAGFELLGPSDAELAAAIAARKPVLVIGDENPLRVPESWREGLAQGLEVPFLTVDADCVVPARLFPERETAARTLRPKIQRELDRFLIPDRMPSLERSLSRPGSPLQPETLLAQLDLEGSVMPVEGMAPGTAAGLKALERFLVEALGDYDEHRNRPEERLGTSRLSPYLHFGQLGPRQVALAVRDSGAPKESVDGFLEQLIVRRELAVNYVSREPDYDRWEGLPEWGRETLAKHARDERPHLYSTDELEAAATHDPLWNAGMLEMKKTGFMHGYVRMYWAKKILYWSAEPEEALERAIELNDRWFLDGRDPNGYANIAWAIGGVHDHPWPEREVFGKVRSMTYRSTSRKFDSEAYAREVEAL